eukprot:195199-Pyramimonas_sp.AAC.1
MAPPPVSAGTAHAGCHRAANPAICTSNSKNGEDDNGCTIQRFDICAAKSALSGSAARKGQRAPCRCGDSGQRLTRRRSEEGANRLSEQGAPHERL